MKKSLITVIPWLLLIVILSPITLQIQNYFVYSDSPFLSNEYPSVTVSRVLDNYFNFSQDSTLYIIINGNYNQSLNQIDKNSKYLEDYRIVTPFQYINETKNEYSKEISELANITAAYLEPFHRIYNNLTILKYNLLKNFTNFEYQLNVSFGIPLDKYHSNSSKAKEFLVAYSILTKNETKLNAARDAGAYVFKDPYILFFSFNNYSNFSLAYNFLKTFNNYSEIIYEITGKYIPESALVNPYNFSLTEVKNRILPPPISLSNFHKGNEWLFLIQIPKNESLIDVENFIKNTNGTVTGHFAIYAQSAYYTESNLKLIDIVTIILVGSLLIILLRSLLPILLLLASAVIGIEISYTLLYLLTFTGYQIYYISGLVIPPIVFGITIDYSILFIYRYFEEIKKKSNNPIKTALKTAGKGAIFSGLSITLGFMSFVFSPSPLLKNIGEALITASISSIIPAVIFTYTALKAIPISWLGYPRRDIPSPVDSRIKYLEKVASSSIHRKSIVIFVMIILTLFSFSVFYTHSTNININEIVPSYSSSVIGEKYLLNLFNYSIDYIIIHGNPNITYTKVYNLSKYIISNNGLVYSTFSINNIILNKSEYIPQFYRDNYTLVEAYIPYPVFSSKAIDFTKSIINQGYEVGGSNAQRIYIVNNTVSNYYNFVLPFTILIIIFYLFVILGSIVVPIRLALTLIVSSLTGVATMDLVFHSVYWLSPLIVFAMLFSIGIDYDMFIILRIIEEKGSEEKRILTGIKNSGLVVTAAGLILAGAFFSLVATNMRFLQEIGFSVGFSVLFDTFIVRPIFVPAIMSFLKQYNWWPKIRKIIR